jgi:hypothetical protein
MLREDFFRDEAFEAVKEIRIEGYNGDYLDEGDVVNLLWKYYQIGYQDRIDDYDGAEDTTAEDEFNRTR